MSADPAVFIYHVDSQDRVVSVGPNWDRFATENAAADLSSDAVVGRSVFAFLGDVETRHIYRLLLDRVRREGKMLVLPFRCDGPTVRRFMQLTISLEPSGLVKFESRILREEQRDPIALLDSSVDRTSELLMMCSWCKQVEIERAWFEIEEAVERLGLFEQQALPRISHGCCSACASRMAGA